MGRRFLGGRDWARGRDGGLLGREVAERPLEGKAHAARLPSELHEDEAHYARRGPGGAGDHQAPAAFERDQRPAIADRGAAGGRHRQAQKGENPRHGDRLRLGICVIVA